MTKSIIKLSNPWLFFSSIDQFFRGFKISIFYDLFVDITYNFVFNIKNFLVFIDGLFKNKEDTFAKIS